MNIAVAENQFKHSPGLVGNQNKHHERAENATLDVEERRKSVIAFRLAATLAKEAKLADSQAMSVFANYLMLSETEAVFRTLLERILYFMRAAWYARCVMMTPTQALTPSQHHILALWYLRVYEYFGFPFSGSTAASCVELIQQRICHVHSGEKSWRKSHAYMLSARVRYARNFGAQLIVNDLNAAMREARKWTREDPCDREFALTRCIAVLKGAAVYFTVMAERGERPRFESRSDKTPLMQMAMWIHEHVAIGLWFARKKFFPVIVFEADPDGDQLHASAHNALKEAMLLAQSSSDPAKQIAGIQSVAEKFESQK